MKKQDNTGSPRKRSSISMLLMAAMITTSILSVRGFASQAEYGFSSIFYYLFAALVFLVPCSLVCAELASTFTGEGGVFRWVSEGLGTRWGWLAIWLDWIMIVIWYPAVLMFASNAVAFVMCSPEASLALAHNKVFALCVILAVYWGSTFLTFRGVQSANKFSSFACVCGTILPSVVLVVLGIVYLAKGNPIAMAGTSVLPKFDGLHSLVLAAGIFLYFAGIELQAVHVPTMKNPRHDYPRSVMVASVVVLLVFMSGTLVIGSVIPVQDIGLLSSLFVTFDKLWDMVGLPWMSNFMALLIALGVMGQVCVNIGGPSRGLLVVGREGYLPGWMRGMNKKGVQVNILLLQGAIATVMCVVMVLLPSVESSFQLLSQMSVICYLIMIIIVYVAFLRLRITKADVPRGFMVPGGNIGKWLVAGLGILGAFIALVVSFLPPSQIKTGSPVTYMLLIALGVGAFIAVALLIYAGRAKYPKGEM